MRFFFKNVKQYVAWFSKSVSAYFYENIIEK